MYKGGLMGSSNMGNGGWMGWSFVMGSGAAELKYLKIKLED